MSYGNIPAGMRERKQWMLTDRNKAPLAYDMGTGAVYAGAKNRTDQHLGFHDACFLADELGLMIGYVPLSSDPFTIIDLDNKPDKIYDADAREIKDGLYYSAVESSYAELSLSGRGVHIVIEGKLPNDFNAQTAGIECYGNRGFVVMTGNMVSKSNEVSNQQAWLHWLAQKYPNAVENGQFASQSLDWAAINQPSADDVALDDALIASMSGWRNHEKLEHFFYGRDLRPDGGGGSEGDLALMQAFMSFTRSADRDAAAMRMFLKTPRAKVRAPYKAATSNWEQYLMRTIHSARVRVAADEKKAKDYDFSEGSRKLLEQYQAQIAQTQQPTQPNSNIAPGTQFSGFSWLTGDDLEAQPDLEWVVKGIFPKAGVGAIYGESGAGKSFVAIDLIAAIAEGRKWFNMRTTQLPVSVFALEGEGGLKGRKRAWEKQNGRKYPQGVYFWDSARNGSFALRDGDPGSTINKENLIKLCADLNVNGRRGGVVVIDTLNQASDGADENSSRDMGQLLRAMKFIQRETGSLVLIVHHATKSKENQSMRGHSSLYGAMDGIMEVIRDVWTKEEKPQLIKDRRAWKAVKVKDGADGYEKHFDMKDHQIGFDEDGPTTSKAIEEVPEYGIDPQTGEVIKFDVGTTQRPAAAKGIGGGSGGGRREPQRAGSATAPVAGSQAPTWSANERATGASDPTPKSAKQESERLIENEFGRLPFKTAVRDALILAAKAVGRGLPIDGVPSEAVAIPRKDLFNEILGVLNPTCDPKHPTLKNRINAAIAYAVDSKKIAKVNSGGVQYFYLLE